MERDLRLDWQALVEEAVRRRKQVRLTQEVFAVMCGVSKPTLVAFERGKTTVSVANVLKILKWLNLTAVEKITAN